jgi:hypothetical protein
MEEKDVIVARFYDNDQRNFRGFGETEISLQDPPASLRVECIYVDDIKASPLTEGPFYNGRSYTKKYFEGKQQEEQERPLYKFISWAGRVDNYLNKTQPKNGMTTEQIENLKQWVVENRHDYRIVFFDWDRTLTVMEGFFDVKLTEVDNFVCDYAQYIMGGKERFDSLKDMFAFLTEHHVQVYIITRNGTLSYPDEIPTFTKIVQCVYPEFQQDQFIYVQGETTKRKALDRWRPKPWTKDMKEPEVVVTAESETLTPTPTKPLKQPNVVVPAESRPLTRTASLRQAQDSSIVSLLLLVILFL